MNSQSECISIFAAKPMVNGHCLEALFLDCFLTARLHALLIWPSALSNSGAGRNNQPMSG